VPVSSPDIIVVGAGVIGCACAHALAEAGARVSVFDTRRIGDGASQASAGVLSPYIEGHEGGALRALGRRSLDLYDAFVERVMAASGLTLQYARSGTLEVALDEEHADRMRASAERLRTEGIDAEWLDPAAVPDAEPLVTTDACGALLIPIHAFVGVPDLTEALAAAAMRAGATIAVDTRVIAIARTPDGRLSVQTQNGRSLAHRVVLAAGSWAGQVQIEGVQPVDITPVRGQLLHLAWPTAQPIRHVVWGADCYMVPWLNGRVLVGATVENVGFDERATAAGVRDLLAAGCRLIPALADASFMEVRVGLRPASPDGLPIVGESDALPGLIYATGHYRNGVLLAPLTAALVSDIVRGSTSDPALVTLAPSRIGRL
jgi:glycine oxidase